MTLNPHHELDLEFIKEHHAYIIDEGPYAEGRSGAQEWESNTVALTEERLKRGNDLTRALLTPIIEELGFVAKN